MKFFLKFPLVYFVKYCKQGSAENNAKLFPHSGFPHLQDKREGNFLSKIHCIYPIFIHMYPDTLVLHKIYPDFSPSSILWNKIWFYYLMSSNSLSWISESIEVLGWQQQQNILWILGLAGGGTRVFSSVVSSQVIWPAFTHKVP